jgi:AcrR family transcriptional regulator
VDTNPPDNRNALIDVALRLFSSRGYDAVGVQEIVEAAQVTKPTLYYYFSSKRGLLDAVLEREGGSLVSTLAAAAEYSGDLPKTLDRAAFAMTGFAGERPEFYRLILALYFAPPESEACLASLPILDSLNGILERLFEAAALNHGNMKGRHRPYAAAYLGTLNTYIGLSLAGKVAVDETTIRNAVRRFMYGIFS